MIHAVEACSRAACFGAGYAAGLAVGAVVGALDLLTLQYKS